MELFDVTLNPENYSIGDQLRATIDLGQAILQKGGRVDRHIIAFADTPQLMYVPSISRGKRTRAAYIRTTDIRRLEVSTQTRNLDWYLKDPLTGMMTSRGFIVLISQVTVKPFRSLKVEIP